MADNYSFRSSMNGFNRNDVMSCIESILNEKMDALVRVAEKLLEKEIIDAQEMEALYMGVELKKEEVSEEVQAENPVEGETAE